MQAVQQQGLLGRDLKRLPAKLLALRFESQHLAWRRSLEGLELRSESAEVIMKTLALHAIMQVNRWLCSTAEMLRHV